MDYVLFIVVWSMIVASGCVSLAVLVEDAGMVSIGHAGMMSIGAYCWAILGPSNLIDAVGALGVVMMVCLTAGLLTGVFLVRLHGDQFVMGSLALQLGQVAMLRNLGGITNGNLGLRLDGAIRSGVENRNALVLLVSAALVLVLTLSLNRLRASRFGVITRAARDDYELAESLGRNVGLIRFLLWGAVAVFAGLSGCLLAEFLLFVHPTTFGLELSLLLLSAVILGGRSGATGVVFAALLLVASVEALRFLPIDAAVRGPTRQVLYNVLLGVLVAWRFRGGGGKQQLC